MESTNTPRESAPVSHIRFVDGGISALRPVLAQDFEAVVNLLNASPVPFGSTPVWTVARLKKMYDDEKEPGLWNKSKRWYTVLRKADSLIVGILVEHCERTGETGLQFQFTESAENSDDLARDALATYLKYRTGFYTTPRINVEFASFEENKQRWLEELGFIYQARIDEGLQWLGERCDLLLYCWIPEWVMSMRAPDGGAAE
ncbi:MAG: hypothetical protein M3R04_08790 [bacterium]|nr:hypothetical protein [bacterium]